jgi:hypothetical protein
MNLFYSNQPGINLNLKLSVKRTGLRTKPYRTPKRIKRIQYRWLERICAKYTTISNCGSCADNDKSNRNVGIILFSGVVLGRPRCNQAAINAT